MRRPSPALLVALLALFLALGGPAQARRLIDGGDIKKGTVRSTQIKDHTIQARDLRSSVVRQLRLTPDGSITEPKIANGAVTANKLGAGAVTAGKLSAGSVTAGAIADGSVGGAKIADGSLTTLDVARFAGRFRITTIGTVARHSCWTGEPQGLAPETAGADISMDALLVTPLGSTYDDRLSLTARMSGSSQPSRFVLALCNGSDADVAIPAAGITFSYVVFDLP
jgi:hypothetical protein